MPIAWLAEAKQRFPEIDEWDNVDTPYQLWFELRSLFEDAYSRHPRDENVIRRVYEFARWCDKQERGESADDDLPTCVAVCFYEHIPVNAAAVADMPRWFTRADILTMREIFSYVVGPEGYENVLKQFDRYDRTRKKQRKVR